MATAAVTNSFAAGTLIESVEVNVNFQDLVTFLNNSTIHKDGSVAATGTLSGPASDPVSDNQYARKAYVDKQKVIARQKFTTNSANFVGTVNTDFVLTPTMDAARLYEARFHASWVTDGTVTYVIQVTEDGTVIHEFEITDGNRDICSSSMYFEPTGGAHTYRIRVLLASGATGIVFNGAATAPRMFWIADVGLR